MVLTDRALLRLHVEAVWGVQLPPLAQNDLVLARTSFQPAWKLYAAELADGRVHIWRPDVDIKERNALRLQANKALAFPPVVAPRAGISREVALSLAASSRINVDTVRNIARWLTVQDRPLVEVFQPASVDDYFNPQSRPLIGVIIAGLLLSVAHSSRRTEEACELGIDTLPEARRRGYALAATILWTRAVMQEGLVPLYSAFADNTASLRLAAAAGYRVFARGATFEG